MAFALPGDVELVRYTYQFRFIRSGQLAKLTERPSQSIRRRMRELIKLGYIIALERAPMEEKCYTCGPAGYQMIADEKNVDIKDLPFSRRAPKTDSLFWRHTLLVNNTHIALQLATENHPKLVLHETIHEFQLSDNPKAKEKHEKFLLFEKLQYGNTTFPFRPDSLFIVYGGSGLENSTALFLEADRGSMNISGSRHLGKIEQKFLAYKCFYERGLYYKKFNVKGMRCLFVLEGVRGIGRIISMRRKLEILNQEFKSDFSHIFLFTHSDLLNEYTIADSPIWMDVNGILRPLYNPKGLDQEKLLTEHKELLEPFYGQSVIEANMAQA